MEAQTLLAIINSALAIIMALVTIYIVITLRQIMKQKPPREEVTEEEIEKVLD